MIPAFTPPRATAAIRRGERHVFAASSRSGALVQRRPGLPDGRPAESMAVAESPPA